MTGKMHHRAMRPGDIRDCVEIIANHPVLGPRYGRDIELLIDAWLRLLSYESQVTIVHFPDESPDAPVCLFGVAVFVRDEFVSEIKKAPQFWIGPELARRLMRSESPVLTDGEMREANSHGGLNLLVWEGCTGCGYENDGELQRRMMDEFIELSPEGGDRLPVRKRGSAGFYAEDGRRPVGPGRVQIHVDKVVGKRSDRNCESSTYCRSYARDGTESAERLGSELGGCTV